MSNYESQFISLDPRSVDVRPLKSADETTRDHGFVGVKVADNADGTIRVQTYGPCDAKYLKAAVFDLALVPTRGATQ